MGCRSGVYATVVVVGSVGAGLADAGGGGVGVEGVGVGLEAAGAGVQPLGSDGPRGTPFEQAAIAIAGKRNVTNRVKRHFMTSQG